MSFSLACDVTSPHFYRPQMKFTKVMFLHLSVSHSVHGGYLGRYPPGRYTPQASTPPWAGKPPRQVHPQAGTPQAGTHPLGRYTPQAGTPPGQVQPPGQVPPDHSACWDTINKRVVRIPLECNLVFCCFYNIGDYSFEFNL